MGMMSSSIRMGRSRRETSAWPMSAGKRKASRGAATLKQFYRGQDRIELRPANAALVSRFIEAREWERDWAIQGKVKAISRFHKRP